VQSAGRRRLRRCKLDVHSAKFFDWELVVIGTKSPEQVQNIANGVAFGITQNNGTSCTICICHGDHELWPIAYDVPAQRASVNRPRGTMEWIINSRVYVGGRPRGKYFGKTARLTGQGTLVCWNLGLLGLG
jgi:hypothetical protein